MFVTEGPLKGDLAHALSGRTFLCVPGVNQSLNLLPVLKEMKNQGTTFVYEAYDMDKLLATVCHGDYREKCRECPCINKDWKHEKIPCSKKQGELDFVIEYQGNVLPLEIKSGKTYTRHNALDNVLKDERYAIPQALVFCNENISSLGKVTYLPIYMIGFLEKEKIEEYIYSIDLSVLQ